MWNSGADGHSEGPKSSQHVEWSQIVMSNLKEYYQFISRVIFPLYGLLSDLLLLLSINAQWNKYESFQDSQYNQFFELNAGILRMAWALALVACIYGNSLFLWESCMLMRRKGTWRERIDPENGIYFQIAEIMSTLLHDGFLICASLLTFQYLETKDSVVFWMGILWGFMSLGRKWSKIFYIECTESRVLKHKYASITSKLLFAIVLLGGILGAIGALQFWGDACSNEKSIITEIADEQFKAIQKCKSVQIGSIVFLQNLTSTTLDLPWEDIQITNFQVSSSNVNTFKLASARRIGSTDSNLVIESNDMQTVQLGNTQTWDQYGIMNLRNMNSLKLVDFGALKRINGKLKLSGVYLHNQSISFASLEEIDTVSITNSSFLSLEIPALKSISSNLEVSNCKFSQLNFSTDLSVQGLLSIRQNIDLRSIFIESIFLRGALYFYQNTHIENITISGNLQGSGFFLTYYNPSLRSFNLAGVQSLNDLQNLKLGFMGNSLLSNLDVSTVHTNMSNCSELSQQLASIRFSQPINPLCQVQFNDLLCNCSTFANEELFNIQVFLPVSAANLDSGVTFFVILVVLSFLIVSTCAFCRHRNYSRRFQSTPESLQPSAVVVASEDQLASVGLDINQHDRLAETIKPSETK